FATPGAPSFRDGRRCRTSRARAEQRSKSKAKGRSWRNLPEYGHLAQEQTETRMEDLQGEAELPVGKFGMGDIDRAGSEPLRQEQAPTEQFKEIVLAAEDQRAFASMDRQRHADAAADIFFEAGRTGEALARMDARWKALSARIEARPDRAAASQVSRHCHDACGMHDRGAGASALNVARQRQRTADEACGLGEPPARPAHPRFQDLAGVDDCLPSRDALAEAAADRERQGGPVLFRHQRTEAQITYFDPWFRAWLRPRLRFRASEDFRGGCGRAHRRLPGDYFRLLNGMRLTMRVPRRMSAASFDFGTVSICMYQRSSVSTNASMSLSRLRAKGCSLGSPSASATQALSVSPAGSISRSLRIAAIRMAISHTSVSASKCSRRSPLMGTRRIRFQATNCLIEVETFDRASPSTPAISSAVRGRSDR